jgi:hypothetical protein
MSGGGNTSGTLAKAKETVTRTARDATDKIKSAASQTAAKAKEHAERIATDKREAAADRVGGYSSAIHESARSLEEKDPNIAWFTHRAADRVQGAADYIRSRDLAGLREDAEGFARRNPAVFFGGLFVLGLALGNLMKAGRSRSDDGEMSGDGSEWEPETRTAAAEEFASDADVPELPKSGL